MGQVCKVLENTLNYAGFSHFVSNLKGVTFRGYATGFSVRTESTLKRKGVFTMKKNFNLNREDMLRIIVALGRSECWLIEMAKKHPEYDEHYMKKCDEAIALEMKLRELTECTLSETMDY